MLLIDINQYLSDEQRFNEICQWADMEVAKLILKTLHLLAKKKTPSMKPLNTIFSNAILNVLNKSEFHNCVQLLNKCSAHSLKK